MKALMVVFLLFLLSSALTAGATAANRKLPNSICPNKDLSVDDITAATVIVQATIRSRARGTHGVTTLPASGNHNAQPQESADDQLWSIRVGRIWKTVPTNGSGLPVVSAKQKLLVKLEPDPRCKKLKQQTSYLFLLKHEEKGEWSATFPPVKINQKVKQLVKQAFCKSCTLAPRLKKFKRSYTLEENRRRKLTCELEQTEQGPADGIKFTWYHNSRKLLPKEDVEFRISEGKYQTTLEIWGKPHTVGEYRCSAVNLGGQDSIKTTLHVRPDLCADGLYCLNGANCSFVSIMQGVRPEPSCSCQEGFTGKRCEEKYSVMVGGDSVRINTVTMVLALSCFLLLVFVLLGIWRPNLIQCNKVHCTNESGEHCRSCPRHDCKSGPGAPDASVNDPRDQVNGDNNIADAAVKFEQSTPASNSEDGDSTRIKLLIPK